MIKAIIFDVGDVLIHEDPSESRKRICSKFNLDLDRLKEYSKKNLEFSHKGLLHYNDFFKNFLKQESSNANYLDLVKEWVKARNRYSKINYQLLKIIKKLKKHYFIGLLTNSTNLNDKAIARRLIYKLFPFKILSNKVNHMKPEKEIYEILISKLKKINIRPEETIFVDDREVNMVIAKEKRIDTILFKDNKSFLGELKSRGIKYD